MAGHPHLPSMPRPDLLPAVDNAVQPPPDLPVPQRTLAGALKRQWRVAALVSTMVFVILGAAGTQLPKRYTAEAQISLAPREQAAAGAQAAADAGNDEATMMTEMQILQSRWLVRRAVETLRLTSNEDPGADEDWGDPAPAKSGLADTLSKLMGSPEPVLTAELALQTATERVADRLSIKREAGARIIRIAYWSKNPKRAAMVVNTMIAEYQHSQVDTKVSATRDLEQMLEGPLADLQDKARKADEAVEAYRQSQGFVDSNEGPLIARQIAALTELLAQTRARRQEYEARVHAVGTRGADITSEALESRVVTDLRQQQSQLSQQLTALTNQFPDDNPRVIDARRRLGDVERRIGDESGRIGSSLQRELAVQQQREGAIRADIDRQRREYEKVNAAMVRMRELEREAQASRTLVSAFLERHKQMQVQGLVVNPSAFVLSRAVEPALPSFPRMPVALAVSAGIALLLGAAVGAVREALRPNLPTLQDLELSHTQAAGVIPAVPRRHGSPADLVASNPRSHYAEAFRKLLTATALAGELQPHRLLVTSSLPGEGKTTTVLSLARIAANGNRRVVVVDCDLRNPRVHTFLGDRMQFGLADILEGRCEPSAAIHRDRLDKVDLIPAGKARGDVFELLAGERLARLIASLSQTYDLVLIDSPPTAVVADTRILAAQADAVLFCVQWGKTPVALAQVEMNTLLADGRTVGMVLSQVDMREFSPYGRRIFDYYQAYQAH